MSTMTSTAPAPAIPAAPAAAAPPPAPTPGPTATPYGPIPADNLERQLTVARPNDDQSLLHLSIVGDTYTILLRGIDTAGRYTLIDMHIPPGGGPAPHRHNFEEMFTVLDGEIEATFRGVKSTVRAGETINIPANAPHEFHNVTKVPARLLCMCTPPGQEDFFAGWGIPVPTRTSPPPALDQAQKSAIMAKQAALAPVYATEPLSTTVER